MGYRKHHGAEEGACAQGVLFFDVSHTHAPPAHVPLDRLLEPVGSRDKPPAGSCFEATRILLCRQPSSPAVGVYARLGDVYVQQQSSGSPSLHSDPWRERFGELRYAEETSRGREKTKCSSPVAPHTLRGSLTTRALGHWLRCARGYDEVSSAGAAAAASTASATSAGDDSSATAAAAAAAAS